MFAIAGALLGLIVLLATLQYRWLGQISGAERERMTATLNTRAAAFAQDFDRELTRAYLLFQLDPMQPDQGAAPAGVGRALRSLAGDRALPAHDQGRLPRRPTTRRRPRRAAALQPCDAVPRAGRLARVARADPRAALTRTSADADERGTGERHVVMRIDGADASGPTCRRWSCPRRMLMFDPATAPTAAAS